MTHLRWDLQDALEAVRDEETECDSRAAAIDAAMEEAAEEERRAESSESSDADEDDETRDAKAKAKAKAPAPRGGGGLRSPSVMELSLQHARVAASRFTLRGQRERIEWALRELSALEKAASRAPEGLNVERAAALRRTILLALREDGLADRPVGAVGASSSSSSREEVNANTPKLSNRRSLMLNSTAFPVFLGVLFDVGSKAPAPKLGVQEFNGIKSLTLCPPESVNCLSTAEEMGASVCFWSLSC